MTNTTVTTTRAGLAGGVTRESSFEYYTSGVYKGMLSKEIVEPYQSAYTIETVHSYDEHGNRESSAVTAGGATRCNVVTAQYDTSGRYIDNTYDCLGRSIGQVVSRNEFGSPTEIDAIIDAVDTNARVTTRIYFGALGREYFRTSDDGSFTKTYLSTSLGNCPSGTSFRSTSSTAGGGSVEACYDLLARETRKMTLGFDGQWDASDTEYDNSGRVLNKSEPFDIGSGPSYWTKMTYDLLGRPKRTDLPDASWGTTGYQGFVTTITNAMSQTRTETRNALGQITQVKDNLNGTTDFDFDHLGNLSKVTDNGGNETITHFNDIGQKDWMDDPDNGYWSYEYNAFGELSKQTNANLQTSEMTYDGLGRMQTRTDSTIDGCQSSSCWEGKTTWTYDSSPDGLGRLDNIQDSESGYMKSVLYDSLGRADEVITSFDSGTYFEKSTYDQFGRLYQTFDAAGDGSFTDHAIVNQYNGYGYLESVGDALLVNGVPRTTYRKIISMTARGQVKQEELGIDSSGQPAVTTTFDFYADTGRMKDIDSINRAGADVQDLYYQWDDLGNLERRHEYSGTKALEETFLYDGLNRLTSQTATGQPTLSVTYDLLHLGNIETKTGVSGQFYYGAGAGPHAVTSAGGSTYYYDDNGNNTAGGGRTTAYYTFDKPSSISKNGHTTSFEYAPNRARFRRVDDDGTSTTTTRYIGNVEIISRPGGTQERKRYVAGIAIETGYFTFGIETSRETIYTLKDHLGSMDVLTDDTGDIIQEMSFGAWGQRRDATDWEEVDGSNLVIDLGSTFDVSKTTRGFTSHEMVDVVGVIHMNGRIYDPMLGRFLQADPFVQDPTNTQSLNRYSYVLNNPLNATDPSGHFVFSLIVGAILAGSNALLDTVIISMVFAGMADALVSGASGLDVFVAGISAGAFTFLGAALAPAFGGFGLNWKTANYVLSIGIVGGITNSMRGGSFGAGFKSAGIGTLAGGIAGRISKPLSRVGRGIAQIVAAGTASKLTGGKFANGAAYAAYGAVLGSITTAAVASYRRLRTSLANTLWPNHYSRKLINDQNLDANGLADFENPIRGKLIGRGFERSRFDRKVFHDQNPGNEMNERWVMRDEASNLFGTEVVIDSNGYRIQDQPMNSESYNYGSTGLGHVFKDMVPYYIFGNGPNDPSYLFERIGRSLEMPRRLFFESPATYSVPY